VAEKTRWASTELDEETHRNLVLWATKLGMHPVKLIERYVRKGLAEDGVEDEDASVELKAFSACQRQRDRDVLTMQLEKLAWAHLKDPTDENEGYLRSLCEEANVSFDEVLQKAGTSPAILVGYDDGTGAASAAKWLTETIGEDEEIPANDVFESGKLHGFSKATLKAAKRLANIESVRRAKVWVWKRREGTEEMAQLDIRRGEGY